jgi:hypothetical protein
VRARAWALGVAADPGEQPLDPIAQALQSGREQEPVFVAIAAAASIDELVLDPHKVDRDPAAEHDVEVLEADRVLVRAM